MWSKIIRLWAGHGYAFFQGSVGGHLGSGKAGFNSFEFFQVFSKEFPWPQILMDDLREGWRPSKNKSMQSLASRPAHSAKR